MTPKTQMADISGLGLCDGEPRDENHQEDVQGCLDGGNLPTARRCGNGFSGPFRVYRRSCYRIGLRDLPSNRMKNKTCLAHHDTL